MKVTGSEIRLFFHTFVDGAGRSHETPRYAVGIRRDSHENTRTLIATGSSGIPSEIPREPTGSNGMTGAISQ